MPEDKWPDIAEYLIEASAGAPDDELLELIRFARTLDVHIAQFSKTNSMQKWESDGVEFCYYYSIKANIEWRGNSSGKHNT